MKIYIAGARGVMGTRYAAILRHLGHDVWGFDLPDFGPSHEFAAQVSAEAMASDGIIIATPTETHVPLLRFFAYCGRPILCEKPITTKVDELDDLVWDLVKAGARVQMVSQYDHLVDGRSEGPTVYDYYRHGADGLAWDCINIIYHARGRTELREQSPTWSCVINGKVLSLGDMDRAYVEMIEQWLRDPRSDLERIIEAHRKVQVFMEGQPCAS